VTRASFWLLVLAALLTPGLVHAHVERFALVIGNDRGAPHEAQLRYAASDARRVFDVLHDLGGFEPANMVLLIDESAERARRTLVTLNDRIRLATSQPNTQVALFVYYSGHGDAENLHLGATYFGLGELALLVRGSAADFRVLVLDACRSGSLTRVKGGQVVSAFDIPEEELKGSGLAYLTASAADEDAQESDELRGSFFTQALVSALLGAADNDGDGAVSLIEAYRYAYAATLRGTSQTLSGSQHPGFHYDLSGQGELILTRPRDHAAQRALVEFPSGVAVLVMHDNSDGNVAAELRGLDHARGVSLAPGRYFVRARAEHVLYEGTFETTAGASLHVQLAQLRRIEYAKLVRKGGSREGFVQRLDVWLDLRSALLNSSGPCLGGALGYGVDFQQLGVHMRLGACMSPFNNAELRGTTRGYTADLHAYHAWDFSVLTLAIGVGGGAALFAQHFETTRTAPARTSLVPFVAIGVDAEVEITARVFAALHIAGQTYFMQTQRERSDPQRAAASFAVDTALGVGLRL
jgi:hypothetical protein